MEIRTMCREEWTRILEREYVARPFQSGGYEGVESLLTMKRVREPLSVKYGRGRVKIVDVGYSWVQIAAKNQCVWLTAMFDEAGSLLQLYFDITAGNIIDGEPHFKDMYLDITLTANGELEVLDEDELDEALACGDITQEEYDNAKAVCERLYKRLKENTSEVLEYCREAYKRLKA